MGAGLARALLKRRPDLELFGMGGEQMAAAGVRLVQDSAAVSVVGLFTRGPRLLPEVSEIPAGIKLAVICCIMDEDLDLVFVRLAETLRGACDLPHLTVWVLSDAKRERDAAERAMVERLRAEFSGLDIRYRRRKKAAKAHRTKAANDQLR